MRRFVAPGLPTPPSATSSGWLRTPGTSTIRTRCPASVRSTVRKRSLVNSSTGSLEVCGGLPKVSRIRSPNPRMKVHGLIQGAMPRRNPAPQKRSLTSARPTRPQSTELPQSLAAPQPEAAKERTATRLFFGAAPMAERCLGSDSTKLCKKVIASRYADRLTAPERRLIFVEQTQSSAWPRGWEVQRARCGT